jgi:hypothetical protein
MGCKLNKYKERSTRRRKEWERRKAGNGRDEGGKKASPAKGLLITA